VSASIASHATVRLWFERLFLGQVRIARTEMNIAQMSRALDEHLMLVVQVARRAASRVNPGGNLLFMGDTGRRRVMEGKLAVWLFGEHTTQHEHVQVDIEIGRGSKR
jgi:hypothetical protein